MKLYELLDVIGGIPVSISDLGTGRTICEDQSAWDVCILPAYLAVEDYKVVSVGMDGTYVAGYNAQLVINVIEEDD